MQKIIFILACILSSTVFAASEGWEEHSGLVEATKVVAMDEVVSEDGQVSVQIASILVDAQGLYKILIYAGDRAYITTSTFASTSGEYALVKASNDLYEIQMKATSIKSSLEDGELELGEEASLSMRISAN